MEKPDLPNRVMQRPAAHQVFASCARPLVETWIASLSKSLDKKPYEEFLATLPQSGDERTLTHLLESLAFGADKADAFQFAETLKTTLGWPVDGALVGIFISVLELMERQFTRALTSEWVMRSGYRMDKKVGDKVVFFDDKVKHNRTGTVKEVDRAMATAQVKTIKDGVITVRAEQVVQ